MNLSKVMATNIAFFSAVNSNKERPTGCCAGFLSMFILLLQPSFAIFIYGLTVFNIGYSSPVIFIPDRAINGLGIEKTKAASLISIIGTSNIILN